MISNHELEGTRRGSVAVTCSLHILWRGALSSEKRAHGPGYILLQEDRIPNISVPSASRRGVSGFLWRDYSESHLAQGIVEKEVS